MTTRSLESENFNCDVVDQAVTITVLKVARPRQPSAKQMKGCSSAQVCKKFGDSPLPSAFSDPAPTGCPYHDNLNTTARKSG